MKQNQIIIMVLVAILAAGAGFYGGMKYQQSKRTTAFGTMEGRQMMNGKTGERTNGTITRGGFRPVSGEIIKADDTSVTVKLQDGSSKIILLTKNTAINKAETGTTADLTTGITIVVFGSENSDGSVTAQNVQINPDYGMGGNVPQATPAPSK